jgi:hypothetical protein
MRSSIICTPLARFLFGEGLYRLTLLLFDGGLSWMGELGLEVFGEPAQPKAERECRSWRILRPDEERV